MILKILPYVPYSYLLKDRAIYPECPHVPPWPLSCGIHRRGIRSLTSASRDVEVITPYPKSRMQGLSQLPEETLLGIAIYLSGKDLLAFSVVSHLLFYY
jgi:hypothetical protein